MSVNASIMKATLSGALTYGMFTYALPNEPNKMYFTIGSSVGSYVGDSIISIIMPTYSPVGSLMDTMISAGAATGAGYLVEKVIAQTAGNDFQQSNMSIKVGILLLSNAVSDYVVNMWYSPATNVTSV